MPILEVSPYDTIDTALNFARAHANDAGLTIAGSALQLGDTAPATFTLINAGWRMLQRVMTNYGLGTFVNTTILSSCPVNGSSDPGLQAYVGFTGYFDGVQMHANPYLPSNMLGPLRLRERQTGQQQIFTPMVPCNDGLPQRPAVIWFRVWNWENDVINLVGSTQVNDIELRYNLWLPDLTPDTNGLGTNQIPLLRCADILGAYTAAAFGSSRGSQATPTLMGIGDAGVKQLALTQARQKQRGQHRRIPYSRRGNGGGYGYGWAI